MNKLTMTLACWDYDRTRPLLTGVIEPEGIELIGIVLRPNETFFRMLSFREFDASEMSLSTYASLKAKGDCPFVAVPVFLSRIFRHSCIYVHTDSGIERPEDLAGKRIGLTQYQNTASVYARGMLQHDYGVAPESVHWLHGAQEEGGRKTLPSDPPPARIKLDPIGHGMTLSTMIDKGELDALITTSIPSSFLRGSPRVRRLFPNYKEVEQDYFRRTGIFPIMHTLVVRQDVYDRHPWVARSLFKAFSAAKEYAYNEAYETDALKLTLPWVIGAVEEARATMGVDYWPYGVESSRPTLEALTQYLAEQGLAQRAAPIEELFAPNTLDL